MVKQGQGRLVSLGMQRLSDCVTRQAQVLHLGAIPVTWSTSADRDPFGHGVTISPAPHAASREWTLNPDLLQSYGRTVDSATTEAPFREALRSVMQKQASRPGCLRDNLSRSPAMFHSAS